MAERTELKQKIADRLRIAREHAGLSQSQVAKFLNVHRPTISEIEAGRRSVSAEELHHLADIYQVEMGWLACTEKSDTQNDRLQLAARELSKLKNDDLERVMELLKALKR